MVENQTAAPGSESGAAGAGLSPADYGPASAPAAPVAVAEDARVAQWKKQHREVHEIRVQIAEADEAVCYIHNPDRNIMAYCLTRTLNKQLLEAGEFLLLNCWLGGDERCNPKSATGQDLAIVAAALEAAKSLEMLASSSKKL
jgi:hypothetical protein